MAKASSRTPRDREGRRLDHRQRLAWLRLIRSENVGPASFRALVNQFGGAEATIDALPVLSRRGGRAHDIRLFSEAEAEAELEATERLGATLVAISEPGYPPALAQVASATPLRQSRLDLAQIPIVATVGARNGSSVGQKFTRLLASELGLEGFVIASGLARGIDTAAHVAAPEQGTVAVLAGGIEVVYPPENEALHQAIGERGLLISERSRGFSPRGGLSPPQPSDLRHLARRDCGRGRRALGLAHHRSPCRRARTRRFAMPGSPLDPRSAGTNNLLKQGTTLVRRATLSKRSGRF